MSSKKSADLSSSLVAVKGRQRSGQPFRRRHGPQAGGIPRLVPGERPADAPLNFKVDADFRRRFRQRAAEADLKLNELLREALEAWEQKRGLL